MSGGELQEPGPGCIRPDLAGRLVELLDHRNANRDNNRDTAADELRAHADACPACRVELSSLRAGFGMLARLDIEPPSEATLSRVRQAVLDERWTVESRAVPSRAPVARRTADHALARFQGHGRVVTAGAVGLAIAAMEVVVLGSNVGLLDSAMAWAGLVVLVAAWLLGLAAAGGAPRVAGAFGGMAALGLVMAGFSLPGSSFGGAACLGLMMGGVAFPLVAAGLVMGERIPRRAVSGALGGAAAGVLMVAAMRAHCPLGGFAHGVVVHGLVIPLAAALGAVLVWLRPRKSLDTPHTIQ